MRTLVLIAAVVVLITACGGKPASQPAAPSSPSAEQPAAAPTPAERAAGGAQAVKIRLAEFKFVPNTVEVKAGKVTFQLTNEGTVEHNFVITETGQRIEAIPPGKEKDFAVDLKAGTYHIECDVPGHKEAGMTMTLVVK